MAIISVVDYLTEDRVVTLKATAKGEAIDELCSSISTAPEISDPAALRDAVLERERVMSTGIGLGIAVPHAKIPTVSEFVLAVGRSPRGIEFDALDSKPVHLVVLIAGPDNRQARYLQILASVTLRLKKEDVRLALLDAPTRSDALEILSRPL